MLTSLWSENLNIKENNLILQEDEIYSYEDGTASPKNIPHCVNIYLN